MPTLAENLKAARKRAGLSQREAAKRAHVTEQAVSGWERDANTPKESNVEALATAYGTTAAALRYNSEPPLTAVADGGASYSSTAFDAGYAAAVFDSIAMDARHIIEKAEAARARLSARGADPDGEPPVFAPAPWLPIDQPADEQKHG